MSEKKLYRHIKNKSTDHAEELIYSELFKICETYAEKVKEKFEEKRNYEVWMLTRLKYHALSKTVLFFYNSYIIVCLESLLEGNRNDDILKRIIKIPTKVYEMNLCNVYEKYETIFHENYG